MFSQPILNRSDSIEKNIRAFGERAFHIPSCGYLTNWTSALAIIKGESAITVLMILKKLNPPGYMFFLMLLMWLGHFLLPLGRWISEPFNLIGIVTLTLSLLPAAGAISVLSQLYTTKDPETPEQARVLATTGIFKYTRNPMYLSLMLVLTGQAIYLGSITALICPVIFLVTMTRLQIRREETALEKRFGEDYIIYKDKVRRWI